MSKDPLAEYKKWEAEHGTLEEDTDQLVIPREPGYTFEEITEEHNATNPLRVDDYEPVFDRHGLTRKVFAFITDEVDAHAGGVPRNTTEAIGRVLRLDGVVSDFDQVQGELDRLEAAGLIEQRDDGSYFLTREGWIERSN
jgi:hypothetical protein